VKPGKPADRRTLVQDRLDDLLVASILTARLDHKTLELLADAVWLRS